MTITEEQIEAGARYLWGCGVCISMAAARKLTRNTFAAVQQAAPPVEGEVAETAEALIEWADQEPDTTGYGKELLYKAADLLRALSAWSVGEDLATYDAGLLPQPGGAPDEWWQDVIRAELGRAHDFYCDQAAPAPQREDG